MRRRKPIPHSNRSWTGWWIASHLERFEYYDEPKRDLNRQCLAWENTVIVRARNRDQAYKKAVAVGRLAHGIEGVNKHGRRGVWRFEGLTQLLPIYEELEDGAEILWTEHIGRTVRTIRKMVRSKSELHVFDDSEEPAEASRRSTRSPVTPRSRRRSGTRS